MSRARRLLSIGHSYCVALNRCLTNEIARLGRPNWDVTVVAPSFFVGDLRPIALEAMAGELCDVRGVSVYGSRSPHLFFYGIGLREILREHWDLIHCWEEPYVIAGAQVAAMAPRATPLVFFTAQNYPKHYPPPFEWIRRYCLKRSCGWIAAGVSAAESMSRSGYCQRPHRVIPHGVDLSHFHPDPAARAAIRERLGWDSDGPPVVGFLGRLVPEKGLRVLTKALERTSSPWRALFVGSGPMEAMLREWSKSYASRVRIVTQVRHDEAPAYINAMDLMCAPSQTTAKWREQFGRMLIEAFACRVPVMASDSGEIPNVVADAGVIVPERDQSAWTRAIEDLLDSPARRAALASSGLDRAVTRYAWPLIARQHLDFFTELLDA
jgi:glycosyltransferase involved in cell wall biosynthesis